MPRILLVEDNLRTSYRLQGPHRGRRIRRTTLSDGEEALQEALVYRPDLILLDIMMPKISGSTSRHLAQHQRDAHTKIIILTALSQPSDRQRAKTSAR